VTLDRHGQTIWIGLGSSAAAIAVVGVSDPLAASPAAPVHPPFLAHDVGFSPSGQRVW